jgi:hypothetical protein
MGRTVHIEAILAPRRKGEDDTTQNFHAKDIPLGRRIYIQCSVEFRTLKNAEATCSHTTDGKPTCTTSKACYMLTYTRKNTELASDGKRPKLWDGRYRGRPARNERMMTGYQDRYLWCVEAYLDAEAEETLRLRKEAEDKKEREELEEMKRE